MLDLPCPLACLLNLFASAESLSSGEEEEEDEEEEEEEEEDEAAAKAAAAKAKAAEKARAAAPAPAPVSAKKQQRLAALEAKLKQHAAGQGLAAAPAAPKAADKKRPAADAPAQTPQPAKKAKAGGEQQKAPATAPAKVAPAGMANPGNEKEYIEALKAALKGGALKLAAVGVGVLEGGARLAVLACLSGRALVLFSCGFRLALLAAQCIARPICGWSAAHHLANLSLPCSSAPR